MSKAGSSSLTAQFTLARDGFDIDIDQTFDLSEPVAIFGPSGSGKTSILRAIAGLEYADSGRIALDEHVWQDNGITVPAYKRGVGYVFQDARLFSHLSVKGNLDLASRAATTATRIGKSDIIEQLRVGELLDREVRSLSGGETQRVAIARTLLAQPRLLLMDEPVSSLDARSRRETIEYIASVAQSFALPLLYVTHDAGEVARLAATTVLLESGKAIAAGPTPEVFAQNEVASSHSPTVSILAATVTGQSSGLTRLSIGTQQLRLPMSERPEGDRVQLRVFATDVVLAGRKIDDTSIRNVLRGSIESIDAIGTGTAQVRILIEDQLLKAQVTTNAVEELGLSAGGNVFAMIKSVALGEPSQVSRPRLV